MGFFQGLKWYDYVWAGATMGWSLVYKYAKDKLTPPKPGRIPQTSCYGRPLPLVWGKTRLNGNMIYRAEVDWNPRRPAVSIPALIALCEGEIAGVSRAWADGKIQPRATLFLSLFLGTRTTQTAWTKLPVAASLGYPGVAMVGSEWPLLRDGIGRWSWEIQGFEHGTGGSAGDADPAAIIADMLGADYYAAGFTPTVVTATGLDGEVASSYARWVAQAGLWLSVACTEQKPTADHLKDILDCTHSDALWSEGQLKIVPLGDSTVGTYAPAVTVQYALTATDLLSEGDADPVEVERGSEGDVYNCAPVSYLLRATVDPASAYNRTDIEDPEPYHSQTYGLKRAPAATMESICLEDVALKVSRLRAQRWVHKRNAYRFALPWRFVRLEPFDIVTLPVAGATATVQILSVKESDDHTRLEIEAEDFIAGVGTAVAHTTQSSEGGPVLPNDIQAQLHEKAATTWTPRTMSQAYRNAAWHDPSHTYAAVGNAVAGWARHGSDWTVASTPTTINAYAVATDGVTLVAVGASASSASTDGDTWGASVALTAGTYRGIISSDTADFVAVADAGAVYTRNSGATWTGATGYPTLGPVWGIARSSDTGRIVVIGADVNNGAWQFTYSDDNGETWAAEADLPVQTAGGSDTVGYTGIAWGDGRFVVCGYNSRMAVMVDGETSFTENAATPSGNHRAISYTGRIFAVLTSDLSNPYPQVARTSVDGSAWTPQQRIAAGDFWYERMAWGPHGGVALSSASVLSASSAPLCTY